MVAVEAKVSGPADTHPQQMRETGTTKEEAIHNIKIRAAHRHSDLFGTEDVADINVESAKVLAE